MRNTVVSQNKYFEVILLHPTRIRPTDRPQLFNRSLRRRTRRMSPNSYKTDWIFGSFPGSPFLAMLLWYSSSVFANSSMIFSVGERRKIHKKAFSNLRLQRKLFKRECESETCADRSHLSFGFKYNCRRLQMTTDIYKTESKRSHRRPVTPIATWMLHRKLKIHAMQLSRLSLV